MRKLFGLVVVLLLLVLTQAPVAIAGCTAFCDEWPSIQCTGSSTCSSTTTSITCDGQSQACPYHCPFNPKLWCIDDW
jgi:hypothetical protein